MSQDNEKRTYKQKIEYYNEILTYCKFGPRTIHYLMLAVENTNSVSFRKIFNPLVNNGYLKKYEGNVFKNMFTITQKGLDLQERLSNMTNDMKILNNGIGFLSEADIKLINKDKNEDEDEDEDG